MQLRQLVPQEFCLDCDVCCRFPDKHTIWSPMFTIGEIHNLAEKNILPPLLFSKSSNRISKTKTNQRINLIQHQDYFICPCFNPFDNKCKIYSRRPFECQLYPFLLIKNDNKLYLAQDNKCPYFKEGDQKSISAYKDYLHSEFVKQESKSFLNQNKCLFVEYPMGDLDVLFAIDLD